MGPELKRIIESYNDLKTKVLSDDPIKASEEIQALSVIFHSHLIPLALKDPDFKVFYEEYLTSIKQMEEFKNKNISFVVNINKIIISNNGEVIKNEPLLSPIQLKNIYYSGKKDLDPLIELFFCHKKIYQLINFLTFVK